jgi:hypothetical protein
MNIRLLRSRNVFFALLVLFKQTRSIMLSIKCFRTIRALKNYKDNLGSLKVQRGCGYVTLIKIRLVRRGITVG